MRILIGELRAGPNDVHPCMGKGAGQGSCSGLRLCAAAFGADLGALGAQGEGLSLVFFLVPGKKSDASGLFGSQQVLCGLGDIEDQGDGFVALVGHGIGQDGERADLQAAIAAYGSDIENASDPLWNFHAVQDKNHGSAFAELDQKSLTHVLADSQERKRIRAREADTSARAWASTSVSPSSTSVAPSASVALIFTNGVVSGMTMVAGMAKRRA